MSATFRAIHRYAPLSARKVRPVADLVRGIDVNTAIENLLYVNRRGAPLLLKVLKSAVANAAQEGGVEAKDLHVESARVNEGPLKQRRMRWRPGPMGRAMPIRKRTCHIEVILGVKKQTGKRARRKVGAAEESTAPKPQGGSEGGES